MKTATYGPVSVGPFELTLNVDRKDDGPEGHTCGDCGRSFDTERGLSIHRGYKHR